MTANPNISLVASLIADPSRATMLMTLLGGQTLLASELARIGGITPQTASAHLAKMVDAGLLVSTTEGRNRYFRLTSPDVAHALEALAIVAKPTPIRSLRQANQTQALRFARTCYDHLAGELGVSITAQMLARGWISSNQKDYAIANSGISAMQDLGVRVEELNAQRRALARQCLDWSERRYHLAGSLGQALATRFFELGWLQKQEGMRSVTVTEVGAEGLLHHFGLRIDKLSVRES